MIHPSAVIAAGAELGTNVDVGPHTVIDEHVVVDDNCRVGPHVYLTGHTRIGAGTAIHSGAVLGGSPQDLSYDGSLSYADIGCRCVIREHATVNRGTAPESRTVLGDDVMMMAYSHVGHNARIGNHVVIANSTAVAGHVTVGDRAFLSGIVGVHQFVRIGRLAMIGGMNRITQDVPPFCLVQSHQIHGANVIGLRRAGIDSETRLAIRRAMKLLFFSGLSRTMALAAIRDRDAGVAEVAEFLAFVESTERGLQAARPIRKAADKLTQEH